MHFKDYAFAEYVQTLDKAPKTEFAMIVGFGDADLKRLERMTISQLAKSPSLSSAGIELSSRGERKIIPFFKNKKERDEMSFAPVPSIALPATFATMAFAFSQVGLSILFSARQLLLDNS